ncbi:MAG: hypothetical protein WCK89_10090 [bacterium]
MKWACMLTLVVVAFMATGLSAVAAEVVRPTGLMCELMEMPTLSRTVPLDLVAARRKVTEWKAPHLLKDTGRDIVDWPPGERDGFDFKPVNTVVNAFYYLNCRQMSDMAAAIGKADEAERYRRQADCVREAFSQLLFDPKTSVYVDGLSASHSLRRDLV